MDKIFLDTVNRVDILLTMNDLPINELVATFCEDIANATYHHIIVARNDELVYITRDADYINVYRKHRDIKRVLHLLRGEEYVIARLRYPLVPGDTIEIWYDNYKETITSSPEIISILFKTEINDNGKL